MQRVGDALRRAVRLFGDREAITCGQEQLTYAAFAAGCDRLAGRLRREGVAPGARVATLMLNCHRYLETYFAVPGMGAVLVPLNSRHALPEHRYILEDAGVQVLLVDREHLGVAQELSDLVTVLVVDEDEPTDTVAPPVEGEIDEDAVAAIFYTGGTTGQAKGVMLTHRNLASNALHLALALEYRSEDRYLHVAPMFHLADGMSTYAVTWLGGAHSFVPRFDTANVLEVITRDAVTCTMLVPAMLDRLLNEPWPDGVSLETLRLLVHGGAPIASSLLRSAVDRLGCSFAQAYGMTEASPLLTVLTNEEGLLDDDRLRSAGREIVGVRVGTYRSDGTPCDVGEVGEVVAEGPNIMAGYWNKPEVTREVLRGGAYWTGDLGYLDDDGYLFLVGRAKDMIISGGENVYAAEVEAALADHPMIRSVAVIGVPDERWGERVHAVVVATSGGTLDPEDLRAFCRERVATYKVPRSFEFRDELPLSGAGKVLKRELRAVHWASQDRAIH